jgi:hypothetical protein
VTGWAKSKAEAEAQADRTYRAVLDRNRILGSLPIQVYRETQDQRTARLERAMANYLNAD